MRNGRGDNYAGALPLLDASDSEVVYNQFDHWASHAAPRRHYDGVEQLAQTPIHFKFTVMLKSKIMVMPRDMRIQV
jgi:hypothetical protein